MAMAHGQSAPIRRAGWLAAACGLMAAVGCTSPEKDAAKGLDPATKQKLMGLGQPPATKLGTGTAALDQRFDRTTPTKLPSPQLTSATPTPNPTGSFGMPTQPTSTATFGGPKPPAGDAARPQQPTEPIIRTGGVAPVMPAPLGLPEPTGAALSPSVLPVAPLGGNLIPPPEPTPAPLPVFPAAHPAPPLPGDSRDTPLPPVPSPTFDLPPIKQ